MKRVFGFFEVVFDLLYLVIALILGMNLLMTSVTGSIRRLAGIMALILVLGDGFHLFPRMALVLTKREEELRPALGRGKQITSITMTIFYLFLWWIGKLVFSLEFGSSWDYIVYFLAGLRILISLFPQNKWRERYPPVNWGIYRNIPFFLLGVIVSVLFFVHKSMTPSLSWMWLAIILSFAFYLPVVIWANKNPKIGMLMLPKTCTYLWMLFMCLSL